MRFAFCLLVAVVVQMAATTAWADDADTEFFERKIRPALVMYCYECHAADSKKLGGELLLDSRDGLRKGGDSGPAIQAGEPDHSLLIKAVRYTDDNVKMPPKGKLPDTVIADLESWVKNGAVDPRVQPTKTRPAVAWQDVMRERSDWWSLRPVKKPTLPSAQGMWAEHPVDRFVASKLSENGLVPGEPTDPRTFVRRLNLILTGLPPTRELVDQFVADCHQSATATDPLPEKSVEKLVDTVLQSPHFGEHWARHWMDVVRFSETHGNEWNYEVHHAWRYRDYLIRAFNNDIPYDQFIREHLAGDLLPMPRWNIAEQFNESVIGTGFFRFGEVNHDDCISLRSIGYDLADNQIDTLSKAFQATTVACARCHNHKLDAISTEDYYALLAVVRSSRNVSHSIDSPQVNAAPKQRLRELKQELRKELATTWKSEVSLFSRYMQTAHAVRAKQPNGPSLAMGLDPQRLEKWVAALSADKQPLEEPFELWRRISAVETPDAADSPADATNVSKSMLQTWELLLAQVNQEDQDRREFNRTRFETFADFQSASPDAWEAGGQSMSDEASRNGDFVVLPDGDALVQAILPAGRFTHALSSKQNGTLRSPVLPAGHKYISLQVLGQRSSAVRLVSNHCQLNYANYRALTTPDFTWVTFSPPDDREGLRTYAELMTMFDNPKFPDQLSPLGGDPANYKMPWDKAAENPRSYFGVTRVVWHDSPETPKSPISHLKGLVIDQATEPGLPSSMKDVTARYEARVSAAIDAWEKDLATEDDVRWLDSLVKRDLVANKLVPNATSLTSLNRAVDLVQEYRKVEAQLSTPRVSVGVADAGPGIAQPVFIRGDCNRPGETVPRRFLDMLSMVQVGKPKALRTTEEVSLRIDDPKIENTPFASTGSGRLELAERIASPDNPLTSRVMVNRIWHHLFGTGLVRTVDDFGHVGDVPSNPQLLDYLADQFVTDGWSIKRTIRSLVLTRTFQLSNHMSAAAKEIDPQNRLLQHYPARRMEAESVRDAIMVASGRLDRTLYGPSIQPFREKEYADRRLFPGPLDGGGRRSVYIKNNLMEGPKFLGVFNFPGGKLAQGRRDVTNVPAQALALLNDPFVIQQADVWAMQLMTRSSDSIATRLDAMFLAALNRSPTAEEQARFEQAIRQLSALHQVSDDSVMSSQVVWKDIAHAIFNMNEMIYIP